MSSKPLLFATGIPSNFYPAAITLPHPLKPHKEATFPTNEHYFHACKVSICDEGTIDMYREIAGADTPQEAKRLGHTVPLDPYEIELWNHYFAMVSMLECNLAKYRQHPKCRKWLLATGSAPLIEHRRDRIWADGMDGSGKNLLGKILELVRTNLR